MPTPSDRSRRMTANRWAISSSLSDAVGSSSTTMRARWASPRAITTIRRWAMLSDATTARGSMSTSRRVSTSAARRFSADQSTNTPAWRG